LAGFKGGLKTEIVFSRKKESDTLFESVLRLTIFGSWAKDSHKWLKVSPLAWRKGEASFASDCTVPGAGKVELPPVRGASYEPTIAILSPS